jgi:hypothetical protein
MKTLKYLSAAALLSNLWASSAVALPIAWTDWQTGTAAVATGQLTVGLDVIDVTATSTSNYNLVQTGTGTNYLTGHISNPSGSAYTNGEVDNIPTPSELIQLNVGGTVTLTFSQAVENIFIAIVSANGNTMDFGTAITIDSNGRGFWGIGTPIVNGTGTGFTGSGEVHGVIKAAGSFTSLSFTHTTENWHRFTLGVAGLAPSNVPEPASFLILLSGLAGLRLMRRETALSKPES